jgi:hypothetical protein
MSGVCSRRSDRNESEEFQFISSEYAIDQWDFLRSIRCSSQADPDLHRILNPARTISPTPPRQDPQLRHGKIPNSARTRSPTPSGQDPQLRQELNVYRTEHWMRLTPSGVICCRARGHCTPGGVRRRVTLLAIDIALLAECRVAWLSRIVSPPSLDQIAGTAHRDEAP